MLCPCSTQIKGCCELFPAFGAPQKQAPGFHLAVPGRWGFGSTPERWRVSQCCFLPLSLSTLEGYYVDDALQGQGIYTYEDGVVLHGTYVDGELNGPAQEYDSDGRLIFKGQYKDNIRHGVCWIYYPVNSPPALLAAELQRSGHAGCGESNTKLKDFNVECLPSRWDSVRLRDALHCFHLAGNPAPWKCIYVSFVCHVEIGCLIIYALSLWEGWNNDLPVCSADCRWEVWKPCQLLQPTALIKVGGEALSLCLCRICCEVWLCPTHQM